MPRRASAESGRAHGNPERAETPKKEKVVRLERVAEETEKKGRRRVAVQEGLSAEAREGKMAELRDLQAKHDKAAAEIARLSAFERTPGAMTTEEQEELAGKIQEVSELAEEIGKRKLELGLIEAPKGKEAKKAGRGPETAAAVEKKRARFEARWQELAVAHRAEKDADKRAALEAAMDGVVANLAEVQGVSEDAVRAALETAAEEAKETAGRETLRTDFAEATENLAKAPPTERSVALTFWETFYEAADKLADAEKKPVEDLLEQGMKTVKKEWTKALLLEKDKDAKKRIEAAIREPGKFFAGATAEELFETKAREKKEAEHAAKEAAEEARTPSLAEIKRVGEERRAAETDRRRTEVMGSEEYKTLMDQLEDIVAKAKAAKTEDENRARREEFETFVRDLRAESETDELGMQEAAKTMLEQLKMDRIRESIAGVAGTREEELMLSEGGIETYRKAEYGPAGERIKEAYGEMRAEVEKEIDEELAKLDQEREKLAAEIVGKKKGLDDLRAAASATMSGRFRSFLGRMNKAFSPDAVRAAQTALAEAQAALRIVAKQMNRLELDRDAEIDKRLEVAVTARGRAAGAPAAAAKRMQRTPPGTGAGFGPLGGPR